MNSILIIPSQLRKVRWTGGEAPKTVNLTGDIDEENANTFATAFTEAMRTGQEIIPVVIHSTGGDVYSALKIHDLIKSSTVPVATVVTGCAMSAAAFIFTAGDFRYISPNSTIMLHDVSVEAFAGRINDIVVETNEVRRLNRAMWELMAKNCELDTDFFKKKLANAQNVDAYITPESAVEWGLATAIGVPRLQTTVSVRSELILTPPRDERLDKLVVEEEVSEAGAPHEVGVPRPRGRKPRDALRWDSVNGKWVMKKRKRGSECAR